MKSSKLVRDNIPEIIRSHGDEALIHTADEKEYWEKLKEKLTEEVSEFLADESEEELADVLEVVDAIITYRFDRDTLTSVQNKKREERGGFTKRIILDEAS